MTDLVRELEGRTRRAWPPAEILDVQGWECRFASGYTGRANSVNPFGPFSGSVVPAIGHCETLFRERRLRPLFRLTPVVDPPDLEEELERRGYVRCSETRVLVRETGARGGPSAGSASSDRTHPASLEAVFEESVTDRWLQCLSKWSGIPPEREVLHRHLLASIRPDRAFLRLHADGVPVAAGLAVVEAPWVGLFDLATAPDARRRGFGTALLRELLAWGAERGGANAYLQVVAGNGPAESLYAREGFREAYGYAYRVSTEDLPWSDPKAP